MKLEELVAELAAGRLRSAYLLAGPEPLLRDDALAALEDAVLGEAPGDFDRERLDGAGTTAGALLDALGALPVLAPRRLVVLREPETRRGAAGKALLEALAEALPGLRERDDVTLVVTAERPDGRARFVKAFASPAAVVRCEAPRAGREIAAFARAEARRQGVTLEADAAALLAERIGPQLLALRQEIAKASLMAGVGEPVRSDHVRETAADVAEAPLWDLTDTIGEGRVGDALVVLRRLLAGGTPPPLLLGALAAHFRKLARVRSGAKVAGHPFAVRKLERQAQRQSLPRLRACLRAIHAADEALKGRGALPAAFALERLVLGLAR